MTEGFLTVAALARNTGVSAKALRYWERLGLLPRASRSPSGYRRFPPVAIAYVGFIKRARSMGLTLKQMRSVLDLARRGRSPCPAVEQWITLRIQRLEADIRSLCRLRKSLKQILQQSLSADIRSSQSHNCCSLIVNLPEGDRFKADSRVAH